MPLSNDQKSEIAQALEARKALGSCPRCGSQHFELIDGYTSVNVSDEIERVVLGGVRVPAAAVACTNCGYLSLHALGALGLLPKGDDVPEQDQLED